jgi:endonuclease-3 related protein
MDVVAVYENLYKEFGPQHWWPKHKGKKRPGFDPCFEVIVGAILTQNTAWKNVEKAVERLYENDLLDAASMARVSVKKLETCIRSSGYYRQKAKKLKIVAEFFMDKMVPVQSGRSHFAGLRGTQSASNHHSQKINSTTPSLNHFITPTREQLLSLWGIGPETADSILLYAFNQPIFVVDTYTRRLLAVNGQKKLSEADYDKIRKFFEDRLPADAKLFKEYHALIVRWGKSVKNVKT